LLALLRRHRAALVLADLPYLPHPLDLGLDPVTADFGYVRLIGDRKATEEKTKTFDRIVIDRDAQLARWAELLRALLERLPAVFVFANNHFAGFAPATIRDLAARVDRSG
jgi:uncharacterized protein YecE (DUF72 family)